MVCFVAQARSAFGRRAEPERSDGGWSKAQRSGAKWRGRGLGKRNVKIFKKNRILQNKKEFDCFFFFFCYHFFWF